MTRKKIIILVNDIKKSFFVNEIPYLKKNFNSITIIAFNKLLDEDKHIIEKYDLKGEFISLSSLRPKHIISLLKWFLESHVRNEIKEKVSLTKEGIKKLGYIIFYGLFRVLTLPIIEKEIKGQETGEDIYLYSYWLSRPAYCICGLKEKYSNYNIKSFSRAHRYDLYESRNSMNYLPFREFISKELDCIYFISRDGYDYFKKKYHELPNNKLKISYLGTYNKRGYRKEIFEKKKIIIASCSSIIPVKRLDLIIATMAYLQKKKLPIFWLHIGTGELFEIIKQKAGQELEKESFLFLGQVDNSSILQTYMQYDVDYFINLSDSEGIPVSIMEAMSLGIPVITRNVGGNGEIVSDKTGYLINTEEINFENLYTAVCERLFDLETYKKKSIASKERWESLFSADQNYTSFYQSITEK